jgi:glucosyl-dolichyl phosphate glucuronosyltransferase
VGTTSILSTQGPATLDITVILCTYNRCEDLAGALQSIAASQVASSVTWEVLVVDNNSTDRTRDVVEDFSRQQCGRFRYLFEPRPGKSYALNAGIANARGRVLAFTDDDVTVNSTWLQNLTAVLLSDGQWAGAGGRTLLAQKFSPPSWLSNDFDSWAGIVFAYFDLGNNACELDRAPFGANMAFRTDLGPGPNPDIPRPNEDTELGRRLLAAGERLRYEPSAVIYHVVAEGRVTKEYFFSWWFDYGRAVIREKGGGAAVYGIPRSYLSLLRRVAEIPVLSVRWMLAVDPHKRFRYKCWVWKGAGQVVELYRRAVNHKGIKAVGV